MNCRNAGRSIGAPPPSFVAVQSKLLRIVCCHEQLKVSFDQLRSQIGTGLKTAEMAEESRFSTIVTSFECSQSQVTFGVIFNDDSCANIFEALVGTLHAAKKRKIVTYDGELLLQGVHDNAAIKLKPEATTSASK